MLALIAGLVALDQRNQARERETAADAQRLGAQALASNDFDLGVLLARQGVALHDTVQSRGNLLAALLKNPAAVGVIRGLRQPGIVVLSPDGQRFAATSADLPLRVVDARTGRIFDSGWNMFSGGPVEFDRAGARVALGSSEPNLVDAQTGRELVRFKIRGWVFAFAFSADQRDVFAVHSEGSNTNLLQRFDTGSGAPTGPVRLLFSGVVEPVDEEHLPAVLASRDGRYRRDEHP